MYVERRVRVRSPHKDWSEPGPDLLRTRRNAIAHLKEMGWARYTSVRAHNGDWLPWKRLIFPGQLGARMMALDLGEVMRVGDNKQEAFAFVRGEPVSVSTVTNATADAELVHALVYHQFAPKVIWAGIYLCKRVNGSSSPQDPWSDHAWGDADDETPKPDAGLTNDELTDWAVRMGREGTDVFPVEQILGSHNGNEVEALSPGFFLNEFHGTGSHLWHNHYSCHRHTGVPPCAR